MDLVNDLVRISPHRKLPTIKGVIRYSELKFTPIIWFSKNMFDCVDLLNIETDI